MQQMINFTPWRKINVVIIYLQKRSYNIQLKFLMHHCPTIHWEELEEAARENIFGELEVKIVFNYLVFLSTI